MKVTARRYAFCRECSTITDDELDAEYTVQWIVDAPEPKRGAWGVRKPATYRCQVCGTENH
jgi:hypothetical protein